MSMSARRLAFASGGDDGDVVQDFTPFWGAAVAGNGDPSVLESPAGRVLGFHRTYWNDSDSKTSGSLTMASGDVSAGRVPWLSYKVSHSWADMAGGAGDTWFEQLCQDLNALGGPVLLTIHHEPEGDGPIADWVAMQAHLYPLSASYANIRYGPILTGYDTIHVAGYGLNDLWPDEYTAGDFLGFDGYNAYGTTNSHGTYIDTFTEMDTYYQTYAPWAAAHNVPWAVGEFGYTDVAAQQDIEWITRAYDNAVSHGGCLALSYFDSVLNSSTGATWPVEDTQPKLDAWVAILQDSIAPHTGWPHLKNI